MIKDVNNRYIRQFEPYKNSIDFLWLEITQKCNLNCVHCYAESSPHSPMTGRMDFAKWKKTLNEAYTLGCRAIQFIGGEPTIHPDFLNLIDLPRKIGYEFIEVYTNGIHITDAMFESFLKNKINLAFSVYSHKSDTHDKITTRIGSFYRTINSIEKAISLGIEVRAGIISMEENKSDIEETVKLLNQLGVKDVKPDKVRGIGRGDRHNNVTDPYSELCGACWRGKLAVNSDGYIFPCVFSHFFPIGEVDDGLETLLIKPNLVKFRKQVFDQNLKFKLSSKCDPICCSPETDCSPDECNPDCSPSCSPNCSPNCIPDCSPTRWCDPNCNPFKDCNPQSCSPDSKKSDGGGCFITTATLAALNKPDNCQELETFRNFRDKWLIKQPDGKELIAEYYYIAPKVVNSINNFKDNNSIYKEIWHFYLVKCYNNIVLGEFETAKSLYITLTENLKNKYL